MKPARLIAWFGIALAVSTCGVALALWSHHSDALDPQFIAARIGPHRYAWYALPTVMLAFTALGFAMVPVLLLIAATGIAFGPWLGPLYAMAGSLASGSAGFWIGRALGRRRMEAIGGERVVRALNALKRNGTLAVFIVRKIPAPFTLVNIVIGASTVRFRDFLAGTLLGMGAFVVALAGFGYQLGRLLTHPTPAALALAALALCVPLSIAWFVNRKIRDARTT